MKEDTVEKDKAAVRITSQTKGNAISITYSDRSRKIAGDRWLVELVGEMETPITQNFWAAVSEDDALLLECIRKNLGDRLQFSISRIRNFVAVHEKEAVFNELLDRFEKNIAPYMDKPDFVRKLFMKNFNEARKRCVADRDTAQGDMQDVEEDEGPADFSDLFK
jgi:flagellar motor switch protein FliG